MRVRRISAWAAVFMMIPCFCMAAGKWYTVSDKLSAESLGLPDDEYTGTVTMTFLGDCTLGGEEKKARQSLSFASRIAENGMDFPFRGLKQLTETDDLTVANLEVVLSDRKLKKEKKEFNFIGPTANTQILKEGNIECVTVANNHTHDYGNEGYADTKKALEEAGICWFGVDAPAIWRSDEGLMIGFLGVNYSLTGNRAKRFAAQAEKLRDFGCAAVITVMHAGTEYSYRPPDNYQAQIVERAVKAGSCLVIGHHPHVLQGVVMKDNVPVVYSLGNCSFGGTTFAKDNDALVVRAELRFGAGELREIALTFYPISITSDKRHNNYSPCLLTGDDAERVLKKMTETTGTDPGVRNPDGSVTLIIQTGHDTIEETE